MRYISEMERVGRERDTINKRHVLRKQKGDSWRAKRKKHEPEAGVDVGLLRGVKKRLAPCLDQVNRLLR
jgi:hypothetical protein